MVSLQYLPFIAVTSLLTLLLFALAPTALSLGPAIPSPTISDCLSRLLPLSPCAPFVRGTLQSPSQTCCINLKQIYSQQRGCLCLLLNGTTLSNMPINATLALQLPALCGLQTNGHACLGAPASTGSQASLGTNSTVAASPMTVPVAPRPSIMGLGLGRSAGIMLKPEGRLAAGVAGSAILFTICQL